MISLLVAVALVVNVERVESNGNYHKIGDEGKAFGGLQIHKICVDDTNRIYGTKYKHNDAFDKKKAHDIFDKYVAHYAKQYERETGKPATNFIKARIWNGGPFGYTNKKTIKYARKVCQKT
jgi:hypothetical protein